MNTLPTFEEFLATQSTPVGVWSFLANLGLTAVLAWLLSKLYKSHGSSLSNRTLFARNFLLLAMTTMFIITVVKSSLALSLGLVGALSIVRFRAAIKEPEELAYLFFTISIGLGLGANQTLLTVLAFLVIVAVILLGRRFRKAGTFQSLSLTVSSDRPERVRLEEVADILEDHCPEVALKRFDESGQAFEATFRVILEGFGQLTACRDVLKELDGSLRITFLDPGELVP